MWLGTVNNSLPIRLGPAIVLCLSETGNPNREAKKTE